MAKKKAKKVTAKKAAPKNPALSARQEAMAGELKYQQPGVTVVIDLDTVKSRTEALVALDDIKAKVVRTRAFQ